MRIETRYKGKEKMEELTKNIIFMSFYFLFLSILSAIIAQIDDRFWYMFPLGIIGSIISIIALSISIASHWK